MCRARVAPRAPLTSAAEYYVRRRVRCRLSRRRCQESARSRRRRGRRGNVELEVVPWLRESAANLSRLRARPGLLRARVRSGAPPAGSAAGGAGLPADAPRSAPARRSDPALARPAAARRTQDSGTESDATVGDTSRGGRDVLACDRGTEPGRRDRGGPHPCSDLGDARCA